MPANDSKPISSFKQFLAYLFFPLLILWFVISHVVDKYFLGGHYEKRGSEKLREQFANEIREKVPCLFADFGGRIIANSEEYSPAFDYATVTVAVDEILLFFSRCRGEFRVKVTPPEKPKAWKEIASVIRNSDLVPNASAPVNYSGLNDFGRFFQENFDIIRHEVSKPGWRPPRGWLVPIGMILF